MEGGYAVECSHIFGCHGYQAELAMAKCSVVSLLTLDSCTINIVEVGQPVQVSISNREWQLHQEGQLSSEESCNSHKVLARTLGIKTGSTDTRVLWSDKDGCVIVEPVLTKPDDYCLEVFYHGGHVQGSPFSITAVESGAFVRDLHNSVAVPMETGEAVNIIIPLTSVEDIGVSVQGPSGGCDASLKTDNPTGMLAVCFTPRVEGHYTISVTDGDTHVADFAIQVDLGGSQKTVQMCRTPSEEVALRCHVLEEDMTIFTKPQRFRRKRQTVFRVSTKHILLKGVLRVECTEGPAQVCLNIIEERKGIKQCEFVPPLPGKYTMDVTWNCQHIQGSPFTIVFTEQKTKQKHHHLICEGLVLNHKHLRIGVPHKFKLRCSDPVSLPGCMELTSIPPSAAYVNISKEERCSSSYQCEIVPKEIGEHEISLKYDGEHVQGSPFRVCYSRPGDASQCCMVGSHSSVHLGGSAVVQISTAGAGKGKLQAGAEDTRTHQTIHVSVKKTAEHLYRLKFRPGPYSECLLAVKYDCQHISGSPFKLRFDKQGNCRAEGKGLLSARTGEWNKFNVHLDEVCLGSGALWVNVEGADGETVATSVSNLSPTHFEISYMPPHPGNYIIAIKLGTASIPGSPFKVKCYGTEGQPEHKKDRCSVVSFTRASQLIPSSAWMDEPLQDTLTRIKEMSRVNRSHIKEAVTFL